MHACVRACVYESDSDSDLPIKVMQGRDGVMGQKEKEEGRETASGKKREERKR